MVAPMVCQQSAEMVCKQRAMTTVFSSGRIPGYRWVRAFATLLVVVLGGSALAQTVVVFVNGEPITAMDLEQRSKFLFVTSQKHPPRQEVLDQLIDEKLKIREGARWGVSAS